MPVYVYQLINADGSDGDVFEIEQGLNDPALTLHPLSGQPMRRVLQPPNLGGQYNERVIREQVTNPDNLERLGFTRYHKDKVTGKYYKTSGKDARAPEVIDPKKLATHADVDALMRENGM